MTLLDQRFFDELTPFIFNETCTIYEDTGTSFSPLGEKLESWTILSRHSNIPCLLSELQEADARRGHVYPQESTHQILLAGYYPSIKAKHEARGGFGQWHIDKVVQNSFGGITMLYVSHGAT